MKCLRSLCSLGVSIPAGQSLAPTVFSMPCMSFRGRRLQTNAPQWCAGFRVPRPPGQGLDVKSTLSPGNEHLMGGLSVLGHRTQGRVLSRETPGGRALGECCFLLPCLLGHRSGRCMDGESRSLPTGGEEGPIHRLEMTQPSLWAPTKCGLVPGLGCMTPFTFKGGSATC